jgi:hypothetical protein
MAAVRSTNAEITDVRSTFSFALYSEGQYRNQQSCHSGSDKRGGGIEINGAQRMRCFLCMANGSDIASPNLAVLVTA